MSDSDYDLTSSSRAKGGGSSSKAPAPKVPAGLSNADHTSLLDLLLQQTAQSAVAARSTVDPEELVRVAKRAVEQGREALGAYAVPESGLTPTRLFRSLDGAYGALRELSTTMHGHVNSAVKNAAPAIDGVLRDLNGRFQPDGWHVPASDGDARVRAQGAAQAGATTLDAGERGELGRMHLRAARQYIIGSWGELDGSKLVTVVQQAAESLREAMTLLVDPHVADSSGGIRADMEATEQVVGRLMMYLETHQPKALDGLRGLATNMDSLRVLVGDPPTWVARLGPASAPASTNATPSANTTSSPAPAGAAAQTNDVDRGPPRAEPPQHRLGSKGEIRTWSKKVHIKDTNYIDEYLGYIELFFEAFRTESGQVYVQRAKATKNLEGRAGQYLSMGADVVANSIELNGQRFCDVYFDVQIGGPNKTETTAISAGIKGGGSNSDKTISGEGSIGVVFSSAVSSQGTRAFRRVYRIRGLDKVDQVFRWDEGQHRLLQTPTMMNMEERADLHRDFEDFELDDDDVGDTLTTFYADWVIHSYDD